jgi:hypothetical protein
VITGYNTDVKHNSRVFHIQTEDKGEQSPYIESLVYVGGQILATRKISYAEVVKNGRDDKAIQELMEQQHRTMIAAIQRGRFDGPNNSVRTPEGMSDGTAGAPAGKAGAAPGAEPEAESAGDRTLDQVILDYLAAELTHEQIDVLFAPIPEFQAGRTADFKLKAETSATRQPITGAVVQIRILSTVSKPEMAYQGKTTSDGSCSVSFPVPAMKEGSAAVVIRVSSPTGSTEYKYMIKRTPS